MAASKSASSEKKADAPKEQEKEQEQAPRSAEGAPDGAFTEQQLVENSLELLGQPSYVVNVALSRHGGGKAYYTKADAEAAVKKLNDHEIEVK